MGGRGKQGLKKEDAYALEMHLQLKRAEREQRRLQLSVEFASTLADVSEKKRQLDRLGAAVADIEATRIRKSREFGHMQVSSFAFALPALLKELFLLKK